eukprot:1272684-Pleurochrysis_carterae.AAC.1
MQHSVVLSCGYIPVRSTEKCDKHNANPISADLSSGRASRRRAASQFPLTSPILASRPERCAMAKVARCLLIAANAVGALNTGRAATGLSSMREGSVQVVARSRPLMSTSDLGSTWSSSVTRRAALFSVPVFSLALSSAEAQAEEVRRHRP